MNICVVGGAGFVGYHVAKFYLEQEHNVIVLDNLSRAQLLGKEIKNITSNIVDLADKFNMTFYNIDIRSYETLVMFFMSNKIDVVIHCAAQTAVTVSMKNPKLDFESNCLGTFNLLEAIRESGQKPIFLYCSTNKVYGDNMGFDYDYVIDEKVSIDHCQHTPYGVSKLCGDLYVQEYGRTYGFRTGVFRMSCIYGTHQLGVEDQGWVMHFILSALEKKAITIFGDGLQVRDILYVSDLVSLFDKFITSNHKSDVFNVGGGFHNSLSLLDLIHFIAHIIENPMVINYEDVRPADQEFYVSDTSKVREQLNWRAKVDWKDGVRNIIEWVKTIKYL